MQGSHFYSSRTRARRATGPGSSFLPLSVWIRFGGGGTPRWRKRWLIIRFKVIICSTIKKKKRKRKMSLNWEIYPGNNGETNHCCLQTLCFAQAWENESRDTTAARQAYNKQGRSAVSIFVSIIKHSTRLEQILIKCLHWCSLQFTLFSLFVGYVSRC